MPHAPLLRVERTHFARIAEWSLAALGFLLLIFLKARYLTSLPVNPDEPQHLHLAWAWTQGLVHYRDVFDNHTPLFHMLISPLVGWLGERADILYPMRLAMVPISAASLGCIYWITARLYTHRAGVWAALFAGLCPFYLLISTEFRTDNLWALCWFGTLALLLTGRLTPSRSFVAGLMLGASFCVSLKTSLLLLSLILAAALVLGARILTGDRALLRESGWNLLAGLGGALVIPLILTGYLALNDALDEFRYGIFEHNMIPLKSKGHFTRWNFPLLFPIVVACGWAFYHSAPTVETGTRRAIALMGAFFSLALLMAYWPLVTRQDFASIAPPLFISLAPLVMGIAGRLRKAGTARLRNGPRFAGASLVGAALVIPLAVCGYEIDRSLDIWGLEGNSLKAFAENLTPKLKLTGPSDYVMDAKGETIFRRRPFYHVLERVTLIRLKRGLIANTIEEDCLRTNTLMISDNRIPQEHLKWLKDSSYIRVHTDILVAGRMLPEKTDSQSRPFTLELAAEYEFVSPQGPMKGVLDGKSIEGTIYLKPGTYQFIPEEEGQGPVAVVWVKAREAGFSPFNYIPKQKIRGKRISTNPFNSSKRRNKMVPSSKE